MVVSARRVTRSRRSSASSTAPSRDLAPSRVPIGMTAWTDERWVIGPTGASRVDGTRGGRACPDGSADGRCRDPKHLTRQAGTAGVAAHDRVGHVRGQPQCLRLRRRGRRRSCRGRTRSRCRAYSRATPSALDSCPSETSIRSAGPLSALPPMMPLTAMTGTPRDRASASGVDDARERQDRADRDDRVRRRDDDRRRLRRAPSAPRAWGGPSSMPANRTSWTSGSWCRWTKYSWNSSQPSSVRTSVRTGSSAIGRTVGPIAQALAEAQRHGRRADPGAESVGPPQVRREVAVAEPEPRVLADQRGQARPSRPRSRRAGPSRGPRRRGRRACRRPCRDPARPRARDARRRRRC